MGYLLLFKPPCSSENSLSNVRKSIAVVWLSGKAHGHVPCLRIKLGDLEIGADYKGACWCLSCDFAFAWKTRAFRFVSRLKKDADWRDPNHISSYLDKYNQLWKESQVNCEQAGCSNMCENWWDPMDCEWSTILQQKNYDLWIGSPSWFRWWYAFSSWTCCFIQ